MTGQAAGAACCQAIDTGCALPAVNIAALQTRLAGENVLIHFDDSLIPADPNQIEREDIGHI